MALAVFEAAQYRVLPRAASDVVLKTLQPGVDVREEEIRHRIRLMLTTGALDCDDAARVWAGSGSGKRCAACLASIPPDGVEYEAELNGRPLHFHMRCHQIWLEECEPKTTAEAAD